MLARLGGAAAAPFGRRLPSSGPSIRLHPSSTPSARPSSPPPLCRPARPWPPLPLTSSVPRRLLCCLPRAPPLAFIVAQTHLARTKPPPRPPPTILTQGVGELCGVDRGAARNALGSTQDTGSGGGRGTPRRATRHSFRNPTASAAPLSHFSHQRSHLDLRY
ncbi:hypothetical protein ACP70R_046154 [Stipagrostis hirtigluma subsp. patula]